MIVGKTLKPGEGVTHDVFKEEIGAANDDLRDASEAGTLLDDFKHLYIKEVIREPRMHYWKVPRLGSYLAIPMVVKSTLSVETLQKAYEDHNVYTTNLQTQAEEKAAWDADQQAK